MPLNELGFQRLTYDEIVDIQIQRAKLLFGDDIDTSENSTFGKILRLFCLDASDNQEYGENVYLSAFPNTARGASLDRLCPMVGISRNPATYAQHNITISGTAGATVDMGFLVAAGDVVFHTVDYYTIGSNGKVSAIVECNDAGVIGNVSVGEINDIVNPTTDVTDITHTSIEKLATDVETDYSLRTRYGEALSGAGTNAIDSIRGAILRVSGVEAVTIIENETDTTDSSGVAPHSFKCYVLAPHSASKEIAKAIFSKKPVGIATSGTESETVYDISDNPHIVRFSWVTEVQVKVKCTIKTNSDYSDSSSQEIKDNLIERVSTYKVGQDVYASALSSEAYVNGVEGVIEMSVAKSGTWTNYLPISDSEVARLTVGNIEVTVTNA